MPRQQDIQQDPFTLGLKKRLPADLRESFTADQLQALKVAFGAREWGRHRVDLRGTFKLLRYRYYFVILGGRNKRALGRVGLKLSRLGSALLVTAFLGFCAILGVLGLYLAKSAAGIDLLPNFSFGVWDWFKGR